MKRLTRWIFNAIAAMSLLLFITTFALFLRSFWVAEEMEWLWSNMRYGVYPMYFQTREVALSRGGLLIHFMYAEMPTYPEIGYPEHYFAWIHERTGLTYPYSIFDSWHLPKGKYFKGLGFEFNFLRGTTNSGKDARNATSLTLPMPAIMVVLAIPPMIWIRKKYRNRFAHNKSLCQICGYDLRSKDRCPECGTVIRHPGCDKIAK